MKLTKAWIAFLKLHDETGYLRRFQAHKAYDFIGRVRDAGLIEIIDGACMGWPYSWEGTRLTEAGQAALSGEQP